MLSNYDDLADFIRSMRWKRIYPPPLLPADLTMDAKFLKGFDDCGS